MRRRDLLIRGASVPAVLWAVAACGGSDGEPDANFQNSFQTNSETNTSGHRHTLTVVCADIGGSDVRYTTSESANHVAALMKPALAAALRARRQRPIRIMASRQGK